MHYVPLGDALVLCNTASNLSKIGNYGAYGRQLECKPTAQKYCLL